MVLDVSLVLTKTLRVVKIQIYLVKIAVRLERAHSVILLLFISNKVKMVKTVSRPSKCHHHHHQRWWKVFRTGLHIFSLQLFLLSFLCKKIHEMKDKSIFYSVLFCVFLLQEIVYFKIYFEVTAICHIIFKTKM